MKTALRQAPAQPASARQQPESALAAERRALAHQRRQLLRRYAREYVAFYGGRIVGRDKDCEALAARLFAKLGGRAVFHRARRDPAHHL